MTDFGSSSQTPVLSYDARGNLVALTVMDINGASDSGVTPGTYGDATHSVTFTVDEFGRITDATSTLITGVTPGGAAGGDLSGSYPNPGVAALGGNALPSNVANGFLKRNSGNTAWEEVAYGSAANTVTQGNDSRLSDSRAPNGAAGGDLTGTYPNPSVNWPVPGTIGSTTPSTGAFTTGNFSGTTAVPGASFTSTLVTISQPLLVSTNEVVSASLAGDYALKVSNTSGTGLGLRVQAGADGNNAFAVRNAAAAISASITGAGALTATSVASTGDISATTAGNGLKVKEGSNARMGTAVLVGGTVTVSNTSVTASTRIFLTSQVDGGAPGWLRVSARVASTSFTITSSSGTDTSTVAYFLCEPA